MNLTKSQRCPAVPDRSKIGLTGYRFPRHSAFFACAAVIWMTLVVATANAQEKPQAKTLIVFSAMGDVPYSPEEYVSLPRQIAELPDESRFVIHVGDIKTGQQVCVEDIYVNVSAILAKSKPPLFIIPGDNEWNDCANPVDGWAWWMKHFSRFEEKWQHGLAVKRQSKRDENFAFVQSEVLFIGLNLVGGRIHDSAEWKQRHAENLEWTKDHLEQNRGTIRSAIIFGHAKPTVIHDDYFNGLCDAATQFNKPILYLQGDGHRWIQDRPFKAQNILRIQVDQGGIAPPIKVTVTDDPQEPFVIDRRK